MKKKIFAFVIAIAMVCTSAVIASASEASNYSKITVLPDGGNKAIEVSGEFDNSVTRADGLVVFRIMTQEGVELARKFTRTTRNDETGLIGFDFGKIFIPETILTGVYVVEISGDDFSVKYRNDNFHYALPSELLVVLKKIDEYTKDTDKSVADAYTKVSESEDNSVYAAQIGFDMSAWNSYSNVGKTVYNAVMKTKSYDLPATVAGTTPEETEENISKITTEVTNAKFYHKEASAMGLFVEIDSVSELKDWYNRYYLDSTIFKEELKNSEMSGKFKSLLENTELLRRIQAVDVIAGATAAEDVVNCIYEKIILTELVEAKSNSATETILEKFSKTEGDYLYGIDWSGYTELSSQEKSNLLDNVRGDYAKEFDTCTAAVSAINSLINPSDTDDEDDDNDNDNDSNGGSYGGSGGGRPVYVPSSSDKQPADETDKANFTDLNDVEWAREAIDYLYERKVVNGVGDNIFDPNSNVTRAEFIKMIISASAKGTSDSESPFKDVENNAWYTPYVVAAYEMGIVLGDEQGNFYPDASITREDMVTILYRALSADRSGSLEFTDAEEISDYAKDAVSYFASRGIVNGMGDGSFAPKANATRAQSAVIVYRIMTM